MNGLDEISEDNMASSGPMGSIQEKYTTFANDKDQDEHVDVFKHTFVDIADQEKQNSQKKEKISEQTQK